MSKIPTHKISDKFNGEEEMVFLKHASGDTHSSIVDYAHRDDYFLFIFVERGELKASVDFEEYDIIAPAIRCVLPGQVHYATEYSHDTEYWVLAVDGMFVKDEYKEIFQKSSFAKGTTMLNNSVIDDLKCSLAMLHKRLKPEKQCIEQHIIHSLVSLYIGIIATIYQKGLPVSTGKQPAVITFQFKSLLSANYHALKSPSQYADRLNISPIYLNEVVKKTTGSTVSKCIQNEIIIQAKRLLFYTNKTVKEIALELGYEDWAYFTRLFTNSSSLSPTQFRKKHLK